MHCSLLQCYRRGVAFIHIPNQERTKALSTRTYVMNSRQPSSRNDSWHDQSSNSQSPRRDFDDQSLQHKKSELNHDQQQQAWAIDAIANVLDGMNTSMNDDNTNFDITTMNDYQPRSDLQSAKHHERDVR